MDLDVASRAAVGAVPDEHPSVPFSAIPGQSKLFLDHLSGAEQVRAFYPHLSSRVEEVGLFAEEVLQNYRTDRGAVCDALRAFNQKINAPRETFDSIEILSTPDTVAVLTGQQAGLFTGPIYTIYKAVSAIAAAKRLTESGRPAVPIFWAATEDHDFDEVSLVKVLDRDGQLAAVRYSDESGSGQAVGEYRLDHGEIASALDSVFAALDRTEFTTDLRSKVETWWGGGRSFGEAFCAQLIELLGPYGLIAVSPTEPAFKKLAAPIYEAAIINVAGIRDGLVARNKELEDAGYHGQVLIEDDHFPMFWRSPEGKRTPLRITKNGKFRAKDGRAEFSIDELLSIARTEPENLSPGVMLRAAVQDHIFPTICYLGGAAEVAYFAQSGVVYETLGRPVTPIFHRQSFSIVEPRSAKTLGKYELEFDDIFTPKDDLLRTLAEKLFGRETARTIVEVEELINIQLNRLDRELSEKDPTLGAAVATRRRKIIYHIAALREKFYRSELNRNEVFTRRIDVLCNGLYPEGGLQERSINVLYLLNKYGDAFIKRLIAETDPDERRHRLIYI